MPIEFIILRVICPVIFIVIVVILIISVCGVISRSKQKQQELQAYMRDEKRKQEELKRQKALAIQRQRQNTQEEPKPQPTPRTQRQPRFQLTPEPQEEPGPQQMQEPREQARPTPSVEFAPDAADMVSLRDKVGGSAVCSICGKPLTGFGKSGGYCSSCMEWNYDRGLYLFRREQFGPSAESLFILTAYDKVHYRCQGGDHLGTLYVTPGSLIFTAEKDMRFILLYSDVTKVSATKGRAQQLSVLVQGEEYASGYHNFDLQGSSYDGAGGEDLLRICRLIQNWEEASL